MVWGPHFKSGIPNVCPFLLPDFFGQLCFAHGFFLRAKQSQNPELTFSKIEVPIAKGNPTLPDSLNGCFSKVRHRRPNIGFFGVCQQIHRLGVPCYEGTFCLVLFKANNHKCKTQEVTQKGAVSFPKFKAPPVGILSVPVSTACRVFGL